MKKYCLAIALVALLALVGCAEHEHSWDSGVVTKPATCTEEGVMTYTCIVCNATRTEEIPARGHEYDVSKCEASAWKNADDLKSHSRECSVCHEVQKRDGIVVDPTNAQELINSVNTGKVYFSAGKYGDLMIWHGKNVSSAKETDGVTEVAIADLLDNKSYNYYRTIENLELIGEDGAVFTGKISCNTGHVYGTATEYTKPIMDPIRDGHEILDNNFGFYSFITINGITFRNMKFNDGMIYVSFQQPSTSLSNMSIVDCEFEGSSSYDDTSKPAIRLGTDLDEDVFSNISVKDTKISNYYQGVYVQNPRGMTVEGCTIDTTKHNAVAAQSGSATTFGGEIVIRNNRISNTADRAVRFNNGKSATITIEGNAFENAADKDGQLLKSGTLTDCTYSFNKNTYNGATIEDVAGSETSWILTIPTT